MSTKTAAVKREEVMVEVGDIKDRIDTMRDHWNTDEILEELGRLVQEFHVVTVPMVDGSRWYGISCEIGGPSFDFKVSGTPYSFSLRGAALHAMQGVLAMKGSEA